MKEQKSLSFSRLAGLNLKRRPFRTFGLVIVVSVLSFVLFGGSVLVVSLKNGMDSIGQRFGADLTVVPTGYDEGMEAILLKGEPSYFYLNKSVAQKISRIDGVSRVSSQFFLVTLSADCCSAHVQLIGFDPDTDFVIKPWIAKSYGGRIGDGQLVVGSDIATDGKKTLRFFNREYPVAAKLAKTGTGLDVSVFVTMDTISSLFQDAKKAGMKFLSETDPKNSISSVLIKTEPGYTADAVVHNIRSKLDGVQVIKTKNMIAGIADNLGSLTVFLSALTAVLWILAAIILAVMFSVTANERKREFAVLRALGATRKKLVHVILTESFLISAAGGVLGILLSSAVVFPFSIYIGDRLGLPYLQPDFGVIAGILVLSLVLSCLIGPLASSYSAVKISRTEPYRNFREGE